ncbi:terpenoid synthase [Mycena olivaceomarginata]|nr:terpenoid synthase [Mycena olivaceomarginata]
MPTKDRESIRLLFPDTLCNWPWLRHLNPHFEVCKDESAAWLETFNAFSPKAQKAFTAVTSVNPVPYLLAALAYPLLDKDGCRVGCDLMNLFFLIERTFRQNPSGHCHAYPSKPQYVRPDGEWIGGEVARQFWLNAIRIATPTSQGRFIDEFHIYMDSMVQKAQDRTEDHIRGIDEYSRSAASLSGMNIPDEVLRNEHIETLISASTDMILIANDLYSYNVEFARGDDRHNLVAIVMRALNLDLAATFEWISNHHDGLVEKFLAAFSRVPHYRDPQLDHQVTEFIHGLGNWVRGYDVWSFESERYFGKGGKEIQITRTVELLPKVDAGPETVSPETPVSGTS